MKVQIVIDLFQDVFVVLGERHLLKSERGQTNFYVTDLQIYLNYDPKFDVIQNNLALLKLNLPASKYRPACLPPTGKILGMKKNKTLFYLNFESVYQEIFFENLGKGSKFFTKLRFY